MKALFITASRVGDAILTTGLLGSLIDRYPGLRVTIACGPAAVSLFAAVPGVERVIPFSKRGFVGHWLDLWGKVALRRWDIVVDLRSSAIAYSLLAGRRYVFHRSSEALPKVVQLGRLFDLDPPPAPRIWLDDPHRQEAAAVLPTDRPILALAPTANWVGKQWPIERFIEAVERLTGEDGILPGAVIAVLGAPHERAQADRLFQAFPADRLVDLMRFPDLLTVAAVIERSHFFLGNDSGLMHLAAAVGTPTFGVFGPSDHRIYGPWGTHSDFARTDLDYLTLVQMRRADEARNLAHLMDTLPVDRVLAGAEALWQSCAGDARRIR